MKFENRNRKNVKTFLVVVVVLVCLFVLKQERDPLPQKSNPFIGEKFFGPKEEEKQRCLSLGVFRIAVKDPSFPYRLQSIARLMWLQKKQKRCWPDEGKLGSKLVRSLQITKRRMLTKKIPRTVAVIIKYRVCNHRHPIGRVREVFRFFLFFFFF